MPDTVILPVANGRERFSISDNSGFLLHTVSESQYNRSLFADYQTSEPVIW